ncbi:MAG: ankyrin repeat domain-containing protein [Ignavibacteriales bacterium]|nr:ankyrin repeat domain-containing protein [Ignavibacteriales bacterium]
MDIFKAIKTGDTASVIGYIENRGDLNVRDFYNMTPLIVAADKGRTNIAKLLIKAGADLNARDKINQTALHLAAGRDHAEIVKLLLEAKARRDIRAINGLTPYQFAAENGKKMAAALLKA